MAQAAPMIVHKHKGMKRSFGDKLISVITYVVYAIFAFVCIYPFYYIFINSISANNLSERGKVIFVPLEMHFKNYATVFKIPGLLDAAKISLLRTVVGTIFTVVVAAFLGYMFTRETLWKRKFWYRFVAATMYFNAGVIPWYLTMKTMGLTNNFWGYIFPMMIQPFYIILCKTFCESIPKELEDAADIDGAGTLTIFFRIMLPVIKPILATIAVFAAVNQWNSFQDTLLLVTDTKLYTLQYLLYQVLKETEKIEAMLKEAAMRGEELIGVQNALTTESIRCAQIIVTTLPIVICYPFLQKYFIQGVTLGAVKD